MKIPCKKCNIQVVSGINHEEVNEKRYKKVGGSNEHSTVYGTDYQFIL